MNNDLGFEVMVNWKKRIQDSPPATNNEELYIRRCVNILTFDYFY